MHLTQVKVGSLLYADQHRYLGRIRFCTHSVASKYISKTQAARGRARKRNGGFRVDKRLSRRRLLFTSAFALIADQLLLR
jgi:hypothetical protein